MLFFRSVREDDWDLMDADEWDAFGEWRWKQWDVHDDFDRSTCEGFYQGWCDSLDMRHTRWSSSTRRSSAMGTPHSMSMTGLMSTIARDRNRAA